ncbi:hypothetical protein Tco_1271810 [Tanacetum coccineum]
MVWRGASLRYETSEKKLNEHEKGDELVVVVVKVAHELDCMMVVKEIEDGLFEEMEVSLWEEGDDFGVDVLRFHTCLTDIIGFIEKIRWWFKQDIGGESEDDREKRLVMVSEEGWMI